jgi:hypothetical protein
MPNTNFNTNMMEAILTTGRAIAAEEKKLREEANRIEAKWNEADQTIATIVETMGVDLSMAVSMVFVINDIDFPMLTAEKEAAIEAHETYFKGLKPELRAAFYLIKKADEALEAAKLAARAKEIVDLAIRINDGLYMDDHGKVIDLHETPQYIKVVNKDGSRKTATVDDLAKAILKMFHVPADLMGVKEIHNAAWGLADEMITSRRAYAAEKARQERIVDDPFPSRDSEPGSYVPVREESIPDTAIAAAFAGLQAQIDEEEAYVGKNDGNTRKASKKNARKVARNG